MDLCRRTAVVALVAVVAACGHSPERSPAVVNDVDDLVVALEASGAEVMRSGQLTQPFFSVPAQVLAVNGERIQAFEYDTNEVADRELRRFVQGPANRPTWSATPHVYRSRMLIVLYVGEDQAVTGLLQRVLAPA